jgi:hypothetical protein
MAGLGHTGDGSPSLAQRFIDCMEAIMREGNSLSFILGSIETVPEISNRILQKTSIVDISFL